MTLQGPDVSGGWSGACACGRSSGKSLWSLFLRTAEWSPRKRLWKWLCVPVTVSSGTCSFLLAEWTL